MLRRRSPKSVAIAVIWSGIWICAVQVSRCKANDAPTKSDIALQDAARIMHVKDARQLNKALQDRITRESMLNASLRELISAPAPVGDFQFIQLQRTSAEWLGHHATNANVKALVRSIDLVAPLHFVSDESSNGVVESFYPCTHVLRSAVGNMAIPVAIEEVVNRNWSLQNPERTKRQLELLAYTVLGIRNIENRMRGVVPDAIRQTLLDDVQRQLEGEGPKDEKAVERFITLLRTIEPSVYRFPNRYDPDIHRLPEGSKILKWDATEKRVVFLPKKEYLEKHRGKKIPDE